MPLPVASQVSEQVCRAKWDVYFCSLYLCSHGCKFLPPISYICLYVCLCMFPTKQHYPANNLLCLFRYDLLFDCCLVSLHSDSRNGRCVCVCVSPRSLSWMSLQVSLKQVTNITHQSCHTQCTHKKRSLQCALSKCFWWQSAKGRESQRSLEVRKTSQSILSFPQVQEYKYEKDLSPILGKRTSLTEANYSQENRASTE